MAERFNLGRLWRLKDGRYRDINGPQTLAAYSDAKQQALGKSYRNGGKLGMLRDSIERAGSKLFS